MFEQQTAQTRMDEANRCRDRAWLSVEAQRRFGVTNQPPVSKESEPSINAAGGGYKIGQEVFANDQRLIGLITRLFFALESAANNGSTSGSPVSGGAINGEQVSHLAVQTSGWFSSHKVVPVDHIRQVDGKGVFLAIDKDQFQALPNDRTDANLTEDADHALWADRVLRDTDYHQIDVHVNDGVIVLSGHVGNSMSQWRAEKAVEELPGVYGVRNYLISDDALIFEVEKALAPLNYPQRSGLFAKVENGVVVLFGEVSSTEVRNQAEQYIANLPWVRAVLNDIRVTGTAQEGGYQRFLQPLIGKELYFHGGPSVTIRQVVINPHNRCVIGMVVLGQFSEQQRGWNQAAGSEKSAPERLVVIPAHAILHLTSSAGFLQIRTTDTDQYQDFDPTAYQSLPEDWLPPYPYCPDEVLFPLAG